MNRKSIFFIILALLVGIGGTVAYYKLHSIYTAYTAPPVLPSQSQNTAIQPQATQPTQAVPSTNAVTPANPVPAGQVQPPTQTSAPTIAGEPLMLAQIACGANINDVRRIHGEPYEIDQKHHSYWNGNIDVYEYNNLFELYVVNGIVERIEVDDLNGLGTSKGIKVGSTANDVVAAYGTPTTVYGDHYVYRSQENPAWGLDFELEHNFVEKIKCGVLD